LGLPFFSTRFSPKVSTNIKLTKKLYGFRIQRNKYSLLQNIIACEDAPKRSEVKKKIGKRSKPNVAWERKKVGEPVDFV